MSRFARSLKAFQLPPDSARIYSGRRSAVAVSFCGPGTRINGPVSAAAGQFVHLSVSHFLSTAVKRSRLVNLPDQLEHGHW